MGKEFIDAKIRKKVQKAKGEQSLDKLKEVALLAFETSVNIYKFREEEKSRCAQANWKIQDFFSRK